MSWLKWLVKTAASAIVISLITLFTTWYMVSLIAANLFEQLHLPANLIPRVQFSDVLGAVFGGTKEQSDSRLASNGAGTGLGASAKNGTNPKGNSGVDLDSTADLDSDSNADRAKDSYENANENADENSYEDSYEDSYEKADENEDETTDADGDGDLSTGGSSPGENLDPDFWGDAKEVWKQERKVIISAEDVSRIRDEMSDEDKLRVFSLLAYKLPEAEVQTLSTMIERGITEEEAVEIQDRLKLYLTDQEYEELLKLLTG